MGSSLGCAAGRPLLGMGRLGRASARGVDLGRCWGLFGPVARRVASSERSRVTEVRSPVRLLEQRLGGVRWPWRGRRNP